jgi:transcriptional/translational regulatory protein YebC/TACO1
MPGSVAMMVDCQTDNKLRMLQEIRLQIKDHGGTVTPTNFLFTKAGKIVVQREENTDAERVNAETVLEAVLEHNVMDVWEESDGVISLLVDPTETSAVSSKLAPMPELRLIKSDMIWEPNKDTTVELDQEQSLLPITNMLEKFEDIFGIQGVYLNAVQGNVDAEAWAKLRQQLE